MVAEAGDGYDYPLPAGMRDLMKVTTGFFVIDAFLDMQVPPQAR
jgi:hypothetical protein